MTSHTQEDRRRLGEAFVRRRLELDPRYRNRRLFTQERGIEDQYRIINDLEKGNRDNYEPQTKAAIEAAYDLAAGALEQFYETGSLAPRNGPSLAVVRPVAGDALSAAADLTDEEIEMLGQLDDLETMIWRARGYNRRERMEQILMLRRERAKHGQGRNTGAAGTALTDR